MSDGPMEARRLKKLLATLRAAGVQEYRDGPVVIILAPTQAPRILDDGPGPAVQEASDEEHPSLDVLEQWSAG
jgi:hypothetical protein